MHAFDKCLITLVRPKPYMNIYVSTGTMVTHTEYIRFMTCKTLIEAEDSNQQSFCPFQLNDEQSANRLKRASYSSGNRRK